MYCDESGFAAPPNVKRAWTPIRHPQPTTPLSHAKHVNVNVIGALDLVASQLVFDTVTSTISRQQVIDFLEKLARSNDDRPLIVVLDNVPIHHHIDPDITHGWLVEQHPLPWHLLPCKPELDPIEIIWNHAKYFWRRFASWTAETLEPKVNVLMNGFGSKFQVNFA